MNYSHKKFKTAAFLEKKISKLKKEGKKVVFTNGCFDLIHPGHIKVFEQAKERGDILIIGLNSDASVRQLKGKTRPILNQASRITILSAIQYIDYLVLFNEDTPYQLIKRLKPNILIKGGDWAKNEIVGRNIVNQVIRIKPIKKYSTSLIIKKIQKNIQ